MDHVSLVISVVLGCLFLLSGATKIVQFRQFEAAVDAYGILPHRTIRPFAVTVLLAETLVAVSLFVGLLVRITATSAIVLLCVFLAAVILTMARGRAIDCHCFGGLTREPVGLYTLARIVILLSFAVGLFAADSNYGSLMSLIDRDGATLANVVPIWLTAAAIVQILLLFPPLLPVRSAMTAARQGRSLNEVRPDVV